MNTTNLTKPRNKFPSPINIKARHYYDTSFAILIKKITEGQNENLSALGTAKLTTTLLGRLTQPSLYS